MSQASIEAANYKAKYMKIADSLYGLQAPKNGGQGIQLVKEMCAWIRQGEVNVARRFYHEGADSLGDKFPDVDEYICLKLNCKPKYGAKKWKAEPRALFQSIEALLMGLKVGEVSTVLGVSAARLSKDRYWTNSLLEGNSISSSEMVNIIKMKVLE